MPRRISLTNFLNQIKSQRLDHGYQPLKSSQSQEFVCQLSSSETISDVNKKSKEINKFSDIFKNQKSIYHCTIQRILSQDAKDNFEIVYEIHNGFTTIQLSVIKNALQIIADRFFKREILQNMYQICSTSGCFLANGVWSHSNLSTNTMYNDQYLLLQYQLMCLKTTSENGQLPTINIYSSHENNEKENNNCVGCVSCISHGSSFLIDGEFEIELNPDQINESSENSSNTLFWAGEIVYELLRNLGHQCDGTCNVRQSQINVFKNCFLYDGNYLPNKTK